MTEITHRCPPVGSGVTSCCGRSPWELPRTDRMTLDETLVTCTAEAYRMVGDLGPLAVGQWSAPVRLERITDGIDAHAAAAPDCPYCEGTGMVCENHPTHAWAGLTGAEECCGGAGMECPVISGVLIFDDPVREP